MQIEMDALLLKMQTEMDDNLSFNQNRICTPPYPKPTRAPETFLHPLRWDELPSGQNNYKMRHELLILVINQVITSQEDSLVDSGTGLIKRMRAVMDLFRNNHLDGMLDFIHLDAESCEIPSRLFLVDNIYVRGGEIRVLAKTTSFIKEREL